jgi:signal transduction histidine kinase
MEAFTLSEQEILNYISRKRNLLFARVSLCATAVGIMHTINDGMDGLRAAPIFDFALTLIVFLSFLLNRWGYHNTAKTITLIVLNLAFAAYASLIPFEVGVYLFYLPLMAISAAIFDTKDQVLRYVFIGLSLAMLLALFLTDFKLLGNLSIEAHDIRESYMLNLFSSSAMLLLCILFLMRINERSESQLHELAREAKLNNDKLTKTNVELDRFLYSTSHDLRAPLMSIKGLINLAQREGPATAPRYLHLMDQQTNKLDNFIKEIIDYSKNARMELRPEPICIRATAEDVADHLKFIDGADRIKFKYQIDLEGDVVADKSRVKVILNNLISNSIKYHNLKQEEPQVLISAQRTSRHWTLAVSDNGRGIAPEYQAKVFDMFYRADEDSKGSGLGLYIVKEAVLKMNGKIELSSEPDKGSEFRVTLPWNSFVPSN